MDLVLIQKKSSEFSINGLSNVGDVFRLTLWSLTTLDEQHQLLSRVERYCSEAREPAARVQLLEHQIALHSADLASECNYMIWFEESVAVA